tara:strand:- start:4971 stop:5282 length:312 start_codon:yes stop_codon:yes gene_type:complete
MILGIKLLLFSGSADQVFDLDWTISSQPEINPKLVVLLELLKSLGAFVPCSFQEHQGFRLELVGAELQVNELQMSVMVEVRNSTSPHVQRVAAVLVAAGVLDR